MPFDESPHRGRRQILPNPAEAFRFQTETAGGDGTFGRIRVLNQLAIVRQRIEHSIHSFYSVDGCKIAKREAGDHGLNSRDGVI